MEYLWVLGFVALLAFALWYGHWMRAREERMRRIREILDIVDEAQAALNRAEDLKTTRAKVSRLEKAQKLLGHVRTYPEYKEVISNFDKLRAEIAAYIKVLPVLDAVEKAEKYRFKGKGKSELNALQDAMYLIETQSISDHDFYLTGAAVDATGEAVTIKSIADRCRKLGWEPT